MFAYLRTGVRLHLSIRVTAPLDIALDVLAYVGRHAAVNIIEEAKTAGKGA